MQRMTESDIKSHIESLDSSDKIDTYCVKSDGKWSLTFCIKSGDSRYDISMRSQREKVRKFGTLEAARKSCSFVGCMTVIGQ